MRYVLLPFKLPSERCVLYNYTFLFVVLSFVDVFFFSLNCARLAGSCASASQFPTCHSEQSAGSVSSQTIV